MQQISLDLNFSQPAVFPFFGKHTGNPCKHIWLIKAYRFAQANPNFFNLPESAVKLGMTPRLLNVVEYWAKAFKIIEAHGSLNYPTRLGNFLLGDDGTDPYLESDNSLWWLHFQLLQPPCHAPVWYWFFSLCNTPSFSQKLALLELEKFSTGLIQSKKKIPPFSADLTCLTKMYSRNQIKQIEDELALGWVKLGIFSCYKTSEKEEYSFRIGKKLNLSDELIVAACVDFYRRQSPTSSIKISELAYLPASPGNCFKLREDDLLEAFDNCRHSNLSVELNANYQAYLRIHGDPQAIADELLKECPVTCSLF
jgi:hypothetical protein